MRVKMGNEGKIIHNFRVIYQQIKGEQIVGKIRRYI